jgi:hypothetical protein
MQLLATTHDIITVSLKRVFPCSDQDQDGLVNNTRKRDKAYHASPSSPQHASDLDAELEEIDLDEIPLDDIDAFRLHSFLLLFISILVDKL